MQGLQDLDLVQNTLVVFTTDHGMSGPRGKGSLYGLGTEIALLMRLPGMAYANTDIHFPVSNISFRATLAEAVGISTVDQPQGKSLWPAICRIETPHPEPIFLERNFHGEKPWRTEADYIDCYDPVRAVRTERFLYIRNFLPRAKPPEPLPGSGRSELIDWRDWDRSFNFPAYPRPEEELYDLQLDPLELNNVATHPEYQQALQEFRAQTAQWMADTNDFLPFAPPKRPEQPGWGPNWQI